MKFKTAILDTTGIVVTGSDYLEEGKA